MIARSAVALSRHNMGGCVVVAGRDDVEPQLRSGALWDAALFDGLLEAIFAWPPTSLGALVLRNGRLAYREAFLPLSQLRNAESPADWGSRHLAALTLTERCDALAVVVSEERGDITVFKSASWTTTPLPQSDDEPSWKDMQARVCDRLLDPR